MSKNDDGGPAFPIGHEFMRPDATVEQMRRACGMTLRDYFAASALTGLIEKDALFAQSQLLRDGEVVEDGAGKLHKPRESVYDDPDFYRDVVAGAYAVADAMLAEREREEGE